VPSLKDKKKGKMGNLRTERGSGGLAKLCSTFAGEGIRRETFFSKY